MLDLAFDVGEMSLATFIKAREQGMPLVALPLFTGRRFLQPFVTVARAAGVGDPSQLAGKRVGIPQFWMTSSVWHRLVLRQMHGVSQEQVSWVTSAPERMEALELPPDVDVRQDTSGRSARELLAAGEIDAIMSPRGGPPTAGESDAEVAAPAYSDVVAAQRAYYQGTGIFPIMHMVVMREEVARGEPALVGQLCEAFEAAKNGGRAEAILDARERPIAGGEPEDVRELLGDDPWPYGIAPNRHVLEKFLDDARDQGLIQRPIAVGDLFAPNLPESFE
jgi:4,5-dihydroxyphthalate decarboxylase